ncbi:Os12g0571800 [Oryza sativa Japonica Group]|uniref:Os12g0571800 protein n=2 Tax=Oryza sativa subsp. japonica TaxID=39947 RepID=A0A9K3Y6P0_ORYSJ|nr:expressed protein [Oryza sativa Japonica Group]EAZ20939.1 hypothetical protein OsJ_36591 [Oryza sativa Japonica Group]BAH95747.1 Os12g0571800 [Oryza sativa Japonica Group]|eukprot:NP_001177019.1 Os12g0571800 [Oryza sativa Japonica Group]
MRRLDLPSPPPRAVVILAAALAAAVATGGVEAAGNMYASSARATTTSSSWGSYAGGAMHGAEMALAAAAAVEDEVAPEFFPVGLVVGDGHGSYFDGLKRDQPFCPPDKTCAANGGTPYTPGCLTIYQCNNGRG